MLELLNIANKGYPDQWLSNFYNPTTGDLLPLDPEDGINDGLARFLVIELRETFEAGKPRADQLEEAYRVVSMGVRDMQSVLEVLEAA